MVMLNTHWEIHRQVTAYITLVAECQDLLTGVMLLFSSIFRLQHNNYSSCWHV